MTFRSEKNMIEKEYISKNHSKFIIKYHIIFVCKYRKKLMMNTQMNDAVKRILIEVSSNSDFCIEVMETDKDHVHLLVSATPKLSPLQIVRKLKQETTYRLWKEKESVLQRIYWREKTFWTDGYFVSTIGNVSQEAVKNYIENQG